MVKRKKKHIWQLSLFDPKLHICLDCSIKIHLEKNKNAKKILQTECKPKIITGDDVISKQDSKRIPVPLENIKFGKYGLNTKPPPGWKGEN